MKNIIKIDGHTAVISFDPDIEMFRGEFIGLNGGADFYAYSVQELKTEGAESLKFFLETCSKKGIEPYKSYSGKISARLSPEDHAALERIAQASGESINQLLNQGAKMLIKQRES
ncbi:type II toxin-antitoxin system HicB family antitoxin [Enterobacteriaceae bacterium H11S18]|uniref:type II toxin-antitoxin system HicB family antitoxin n=1 Tax=Dryocola clanedunensis TaxID=2925396 RepID=UPI0022F08006|nr:type II toxin-antitoxin system HicB family antitoxin [Dryocola clanedunensis]MCT4711907.1 type II toxin-antitoxin system HicB family antitoxin [Dryocola clanedunensis]